MVSKVDIVNMALAEIGVESISDIDESTEQAKKAKLFYENSRDSMLRAYPWRFALKQWNAASVTDSEAFKNYKYAFRRPVDCLRYLHPVVDGICAEAAGDFIYADEDPFDFIGIKSIDTEGSFDPMFIEAFSLKLALKLCVILTNSNTLRDRLKADLEEFMKKSEVKSALEGPREEWQFKSSWLEARLR